MRAQLRLATPPTLRRPPARPTADLGRQVRLLRDAAALTNARLAAMARMRPAQVSLLETGHNVEAAQYTRVAKALGFRSALEMFRADDADPLRRQMDRAWALLDDAQRKRVLAFVTRLMVGD